MTVLYLRAADQLDSRALARLRAASLVELGLLPHSSADAFAARAAAAFDALFRAGRIAAWIGCDDERVVASTCAVFYDRLPYPEGARHAELCGVYVEPAYRMRGIASDLVREVVGAAHEGGARKTFLRPSPHAKDLYARLGFVDTELMTYAGRRDDAVACSPALTAWPGVDITPPPVPDHQCINTECRSCVENQAACALMPSSFRAEPKRARLSEVGRRRDQ